MKEHTRIVRFMIIGTLNAMIIAGVVALMSELLHCNYVLSNIVAYTLAQIHNFLWCRYWIFISPDRKTTFWQQALLFCIAFGMAYGAQLLFVVLLVEKAGVHAYWAQFLGLFVYGGVNFIMNRKVTFR
ncbi:MAG: GtrA family protein [Bacteroides sp.]|nr:GtrA family protein [Bacteroides sp.]